jgi:ribosomal protein S18 acetylase RimI-like enzyme
MSTLTASSTHKNGLRSVNIRHDLVPIADLIELCFADQMDSSGRAAVREMRALSHLGPFLWLLKGVDLMLRGLMQGFVWVEDNHVVGNVSLYPAGYARTWVIANVAVHPDYRHQGIAYKLCEEAMKRVVNWRGGAVILQVDLDNDPAKRLYQRLGFFTERAFTRWHWSSGSIVPRPLPDMPRITYRGLSDWRAAYELVNLIRPNRAGGLGWMRPTRESDFRATPFNMIRRMLSASAREQWVIRGSNGGVDALMLTESKFGSSTLMFDLIVHPQKQGELEAPLVNYIIRQAANRFHAAATDHPTDDLLAEAVFRANDFRPRRTLVNMRWDVP